MTIPDGYTAAGTARKTRSGQLVRLVTKPHGITWVWWNWFCDGCGKAGEPEVSVTAERVSAVAERHADACSAIQV